MKPHRFYSPFGFVKVESRARSGKRWGWAIVRPDIETVIESSIELFFSAEEAWGAGQRALAALFPVRQPGRAGRQPRQEQAA